MFKIILLWVLNKIILDIMAGGSKTCYSLFMSICGITLMFLSYSMAMYKNNIFPIIIFMVLIGINIWCFVNNNYYLFACYCYAFDSDSYSYSCSNNGTHSSNTSFIFINNI